MVWTVPKWLVYDLYCFFLATEKLLSFGDEIAPIGIKWHKHFPFMFRHLLWTSVNHRIISTLWLWHPNIFTSPHLGLSGDLVSDCNLLVGETASLKSTTWLLPGLLPGSSHRGNQHWPPVGSKIRIRSSFFMWLDPFCDERPMFGGFYMVLHDFTTLWWPWLNHC